jgi:hypothetical protein
MSSAQHCDSSNKVALMNNRILEFCIRQRHERLGKESPATQRWTYERSGWVYKADGWFPKDFTPNGGWETWNVSKDC